MTAFGTGLGLRATLSALALWAGLLSPPFSSMAEAQAGALRLPAGDHEFTPRYGGRQRHYLVHVPAKLLAPPPVLLAFHGGGGSAEGFARYAGLNAVADREGFVVVYPSGTGPLPRRLLTWNAGDGCCGYARTNDVNDMGFVATLLNHLEERMAVDRRRVYATGHSNGGILAHRLAAERSGLIAAVVAVAGALDLARFAPAEPVAVLQIHSLDDPRAVYEGGQGPPFPGTDVRIRHQPVAAGLERWVAANGCRTAPDTAEVRRGSAASPDSSQTATRLVWKSCKAGMEVAHWRLTGVGHGWPGHRAPQVAVALVGPQTTLVVAAEEVWKFVSRFSR